MHPRSTSLPRVRPAPGRRAGVALLSGALLAGVLVPGVLTPGAAATEAAPGTAVPSTAVPTAGVPTAAVRDPYFPDYGNRGYDALHYSIRDAYDLRTGKLRGRTVVDLVATADRSRVSFDLVLTPETVRVDGVRARFRHAKARKVVVTLPRPVRAGERLRVAIRYHGRPDRIDRGKVRSPWIADRYEAAAIGEPEICAWWFACNDHPSDKATYDIAIRVPGKRQVVSNGVLVSRHTTPRGTRWHWRMSDPMAPYLAFFVAGRFELVRERVDGLPAVYAVSRYFGDRMRARQLRMLQRTPAVVRWLASQYGPYPFDALGGVVISLWSGFALENQSRPVYYPYLTGPANFSVVVHELAHQWFGDSVSVRTWRDIWLNEGFATYSEWRYRAQHGGRTVAEQLRHAYDSRPAQRGFWKVRIGDPGRKNLFAEAVYERGAMAVAALERRIGAETLTTVLRTWLAQHRDGNADVAQFVAHAEQVSGQDLRAFFDAWLYTPAKPARTAANGLL